MPAETPKTVTICAWEEEDGTFTVSNDVTDIWDEDETDLPTAAEAAETAMERAADYREAGYSVVYDLEIQISYHMPKG